MGWRSKFVFVLIVYFAGFATAIYCLAPAPQEAEGTTPQARGLFDSAFKSDQFARSVNTGVHKCVDLGKEAAIRTAQRITEKVEEAQLQSDKQG